jgi:hypothetical protein
VLESKGDLLEMLNPYLESGAIKTVIDPKGKFKFSEREVQVLRGGPSF